jgi:hypothetical protein
LFKEFILTLDCFGYINRELADIYLEEQADEDTVLTYSIEHSFKCAHCLQYCSGDEQDLTYDNMCQTCVYLAHELQTAND